MREAVKISNPKPQEAAAMPQAVLCSSTDIAGACWGSLGVGPVRGQGPVDGRRRLHVGPVGEADALHEARAVHVACVAVRVRQADAGVHNNAVKPQALEVIAQQRALRGGALALLMPPGVAAVDVSTDCLPLQERGLKRASALSARRLCMLHGQRHAAESQPLDSKQILKQQNYNPYI